MTLIENKISEAILCAILKKNYVYINLTLNYIIV